MARCAPAGMILRLMLTHQSPANLPAPFPSDLALLPATAEDRSFAFDVYRKTMRVYVEQIEAWDDEKQLALFWRLHPLAAIRIIFANGLKVGVLHVDDHFECAFLRLLILLPMAQRQGIGSQLIRAELERANAQRKPLFLHVLRTNPAVRLYERLGFEVSSRLNDSFLMIAVPAAHSSYARSAALR